MRGGKKKAMVTAVYAITAIAAAVHPLEEVEYVFG